MCRLAITEGDQRAVCTGEIADNNDSTRKPDTGFTTNTQPSSSARMWGAHPPAAFARVFLKSGEKQTCTPPTCANHHRRARLYRYGEDRRDETRVRIIHGTIPIETRVLHTHTLRRDGEEKNASYFLTYAARATTTTTKKKTVRNTNNKTSRAKKDATR